MARERKPKRHALATLSANASRWEHGCGEVSCRCGWSDRPISRPMGLRMYRWHLEAESWFRVALPFQPLSRLGKEAEAAKALADAFPVGDKTEEEMSDFCSLFHESPFHPTLVRVFGPARGARLSSAIQGHLRIRFNNVASHQRSHF